MSIVSHVQAHSKQGGLQQIPRQHEQWYCGELGTAGSAAACNAFKPRRGQQSTPTGSSKRLHAAHAPSVISKLYRVCTPKEILFLFCLLYHMETKQKGTGQDIPRGIAKAPYFRVTQLRTSSTPQLAATDDSPGLGSISFSALSVGGPVAKGLLVITQPLLPLLELSCICTDQILPCMKHLDSEVCILITFRDSGVI